MQPYSESGDEDERVENGRRGLAALGAVLAAARLVVNTQALEDDWRASAVLGTATLTQEAVDALSAQRRGALGALAEALRQFEAGDRRAEEREG